jgi:hypothetical protein
MLVQAVVASVAADASSAVVDAADGTSYAVYPAHGVLPAQGQTVFLARNGNGDVVVMGGGLLVDGSFATFGHSDDLTVGWGLYSDGTLIANQGIFRGTVAAAVFTTSEDDTAPRVVIDSPADARRVLFFTGDVDELVPGYVASQDDAAQATVEIGSPEFTTGGAGKHAILRTGIDRTDGSTFVDALADNIRSNGVSISRPPYAAYRRVNDLGPITPSTSTSQAILWDTLLKANVASALPYDASTGNFSITRPGIYSAALIWIWGDSGNSAGDGHRRIRLEETIPGQSTTQRTINSMTGVGGGISSVHNCTADIIVDTASVTAPFLVRFFAGHVSISSGQPGAALYGTGRVALRRISD